VDLVPADFSAAVGQSAVAEGDSGRVAILLEATCLRIPECVAASVADVMLLYRYSSEGSLIGPRSIALPSVASNAVIMDGDRVVIASKTHDDRLVLSRFAEDGTLEFGAVEIPVSYSGEELGALLTAFAIGANDYAVVYLTSNGGRVARFTVAER
jgi:hypothetical protein